VRRSGRVVRKKEDEEDEEDEEEDESKSKTVQRKGNMDHSQPVAVLTLLSSSTGLTGGGKKDASFFLATAYNQD
jgi:hypothetical protein